MTSHRDVLPPSFVPADADLARAAARWGKFTARLSDTDKRVLDLVVAGESLKAVCFELSLTYDAVQKRMKRWQLALGVKSTPLVLHVWATVHGFGRRPDDPTLLRYADMMRQALGYDAPMRLPPAEPDIDGLAFGNGTRTLAPVKSAAVAAREQAEQNTFSLMSPALWRICLHLARDGAYDQSQANGLPALHEWCRHLADPSHDGAGRERLAAILADFSTQPASRRQLLGDEYALLSAAQALDARHFDFPKHMRLTVDAHPSRAAGTPRTCSDPFWRQFSLAASREDAAHLMALWQHADREHLLQPAYGFAAAITFFHARTAALRAAVSPMLNRVLSSRRQWVMARQIDPMQTLHRQACFECGMSVVASAPAPMSGFPVLTAEQLLPCTKQFIAHAPAMPVSVPA